MVAKNKSILLGSIVQEERLKLFLLEPSLLSVVVAGVVIVIWWCICWLNGWLVAPTVTNIGFSGMLEFISWAAAFLTIHSEYTNVQTWQPSLVFLIKQKSMCINIFGRLPLRYMMCKYSFIEALYNYSPCPEKRAPFLIDLYRTISSTCKTVAGEVLCFSLSVFIHLSSG